MLTTLQLLQTLKPSVQRSSWSCQVVHSICYANLKWSADCRPRPLNLGLLARARLTDSRQPTHTHHMGCSSCAALAWRMAFRIQ